MLGLMVLMMIYALGPVSAAHFNPAVTIAFAAARGCPWRHMLPCLAAQAIGALLASAAYGMLFGHEISIESQFRRAHPQYAGRTSCRL